MQQLSGYKSVIKRMGDGPDRLICFVSFSGDENRIALFRLRERSSNSVTPVHNSGVLYTVHAVLNFSDNRGWVFTSRIVRRHDRMIAVLDGNCAHRRSFGAIAFAATAENQDQAPGSNFAGGQQYFLDSIISMGIVADDP